MQHNYGHRNKHREQRNAPPKVNWENKFDSQWITDGITKEAIKFCEKFGKHIKNNGLSTSQIRNVYGELKRIQLKGFKKEKTSFLLLKPKMAYAAKRAKNSGATDFKKVFDKAFDLIDNSSEKYKNFMDIMEAILAYHKSFGGK